jgi:hypothetical protein
MDLQRIGVKVFCGDGAVVGLQEFIPIFHRWIQTHAIEGLLIDVADYSHMTRGPGILLVAHEGMYGIDETGGRRGLVYCLRQPTAGSLESRLTSAMRSALAACRQLASEPELQGRIAFRGEELLVFANDRLHAPNSEESLEQFRPALSTVLASLYPGLECTVMREPDERERFAVTVTVPEPVAVATLLDERLSA